MNRPRLLLLLLLPAAAIAGIMIALRVGDSAEAGGVRGCAEFKGWHIAEVYRLDAVSGRAVNYATAR
jgi:hypothetical protein